MRVGASTRHAPVTGFAVEVNNSMIPLQFGLNLPEWLSILIGSWREAFVQVSAFVGATVLLFSLVEYKFKG